MKQFVRVRIQSQVSPVDELSGDLMEMGCEGITELSEHQCEAFFPSDAVPTATAFLKGMPGITLRVERIDNLDWNAEWKKNIRPVALSERITVYPDWLIPPVLRPLDITISPKMSFGTGHHETTRLCAQMLESHAPGASSLLDAGTGSGILAIAASKLGVPYIVAFDSDPVTLENIRENIDANHCTGITPFIGTFDALRPALTFDVVIANIISSVLLSMLPSLRRLATQRLILSGLLTSEAPSFNAAVESAGFRILETRSEHEWYALAAERIR
ncbi:MAG: 50S ribosomal protein L11 methyltransferase [Fibrobacterota bacterium]